MEIKKLKRKVLFFLVAFLFLSGINSQTIFAKNSPLIGKNTRNEEALGASNPGRGKDVFPLGKNGKAENLPKFLETYGEEAEDQTATKGEEDFPTSDNKIGTIIVELKEPKSSLLFSANSHLDSSKYLSQRSPDLYASTKDPKEHLFVLVNQNTGEGFPFTLSLGESREFPDMPIGSYVIKEKNLPEHIEGQVRFSVEETEVLDSNLLKVGRCPQVGVYEFNHRAKTTTVEVVNDWKKVMEPEEKPISEKGNQVQRPENNQQVWQNQSPTIIQNVSQNPVQNVNIDLGSLLEKLKNNQGFAGKLHMAYIVGYPDGTFRPEKTISRGEMTAIFARLLDEGGINPNQDTPFNDVPRSSWCSGYISRLVQTGIVSGYPDGTFKPDQGVSRAEFATVAARFISGKKKIGGFVDVANDYWAKESIEAVQGQGWIKGYPDGTFRPESEMNRSEVVTVVNKMLDRSGDQAFIDSNITYLRRFTDVAQSYWAYYHILEATNGHEYQRLESKGEKWIRVTNK